MFDKVKDYFKPKCSFCDNKAGEAFVEMKAVDGTITMKICDECERIFEKSAELTKGWNRGKT